MKHVFQQIAKLYNRKQIRPTTLTKMQDKLTSGGGRSSGSNGECSCSLNSEMGHPAQTCLNKETVLAICRETKSGNDKMDSDRKENKKAGNRTSCHDGHKNGVNRGRGGGKQLSLHLIQQVPGEENDAMEPKVQALSENSDDGSDHSSSDNGNASNLL
jgi:hypothetical protein